MLISSQTLTEEMSKFMKGLNCYREPCIVLECPEDTLGGIIGSTATYDVPGYKPNVLYFKEGTTLCFKIQEKFCVISAVISFMPYNESWAYQEVIVDNAENLEKFKIAWEKFSISNK